MESIFIFEEMAKAVIEGDEKKAAQSAREAMKMDIDPVEALEKGYGKGMGILGEQFEKGEVFLTEVLLAEDAMNAAIEILKPKIAEKKSKIGRKGKIVIGTIKGDVHDIGKNVVKLFLSVAGFEMVDAGRDVPVRTLIDTAVKENAQIIAVSALMTTTMIYMPQLIKELKELGLRDRFKVMVGGAPVIKSWAMEIGADGYGKNTKEAVEVALTLVE
jgi:trimethylamine corrinoid protein